MARILVSLRNGWRRPGDFNAMPPFYETFLKGLKEAGNDVFCFQHKEYHRDFSMRIPDKMQQVIKQFDPELCILFNNTFWDISELVDCPILIYDVDSPIEYTLKENLQEKPDRYKFIINQRQGADLIKLAFGASDDNIFYVPFFTGVKNNPEAECKNNIVFLGSNWTWHGYDFLQAFLKKRPNSEDIEKAKKVLDSFSDNPYLDSKNIYYELGLHPQKTIDITDIRRAAYEVSGLYRIKVLEALADLGLEVRGQYWDIDCMNYFPDLLQCVNTTPTYSKQENEDYYNSAKISINTQHIQTVSGFSFRVCDIMASNACLVTSPSEDLKELFPQVNIPMFSSPYEAREICKKLLADESMRRDIVEASQEAIEKGYRISNTIERLEDISGVSLIQNKEPGVYVNYGIEVGSLEIFSDEDPSMRNPVIKTATAVIVPPVRPQKPFVFKAQETKDEKKHSEPIKKQHIAVEHKEKTPPKVNGSKNKGLNIFCKIWYQTLGKHLGYDPYNKFEKKTYYVGKMLVYEVLKPYKGREETYFLAFPLFSKTITGNQTKIRLLLIEKIARGFKKLFHHKNTDSKVISTKPVIVKSNLSMKMPSGNERIMLDIAKERHRIELQRKLKEGESIVVCLFVCRISCWFFDDLYKLLEDSQVFKPYIVVKPFLTMGKNAMIDYMETTYNELEKRGYRVIKTYDKDTDTYLNIKEVLNPDIVFYTKYWPPQFRPEFYITQFMDRLSFYVPYAFDIGRHNAVYNFDLLNNVDRFLYNTPIHKEMAEKYMPNHGKNVYIIGSPKLDVFFDKSYIPTDNWKPQTVKKKRIIWAPHHEDQTKDDMYQFDSFYYLCDFMFDMAEKYKDKIQIAFKPHPMLKPKLDYRWGEESANDYYNKWAELENGQLELGEFQDLFMTSDAMILDSVSFVAEYMAVNKPALFTVSPTSRVMFNEFGEQAYEELYHTNGDTILEDVENFIKKVVVDGEDDKLEERTLFINTHLLSPNGKTATENIYDNILDEIQNGDK